MNPDFLNRLRTCTKCDLREIVCKAYGTKDSFNTFGFYYNQSDIPAAKIVLIMQNPGLPGNFKKTAEFKEYKKAAIENFVTINQKHMFLWLTDKNNPFFKPFINLLHQFNLIDYNYQSLIDHSNPHEIFFHDFLVTDLVKCRTTTLNTNNFIKSCFNHYLNEELPAIAPGKLVFVFSSRTWQTLCNHSDYVDYKKPDHDSNWPLVAQDHGKLFKSKFAGTYFIPLSHFSQVHFNKFLRNSYFDYLTEGLTEYLKINPY